MAAKKALKKCLQKLTKEEFKQFTNELLDRAGEPRVYMNQIEGKDYIEVSNVMVNVFSERNVLSVAAEVLREVNLGGFADELDAAAPAPAAPANKAVSDLTTPKPARPGPLSAKEFVDKYRVQLTKKLADTNPLLDLLCSKKVINDFSYNEIRALPTDNQRMSKLLFGPYVRTSTTCKIFFDYLKEEQPYLVEDLLES